MIVKVEQMDRTAISDSRALHSCAMLTCVKNEQNRVAVKVNACCVAVGMLYWRTANCLSKWTCARDSSESHVSIRHRRHS